MTVTHVGAHGALTNVTIKGVTAVGTIIDDGGTIIGAATPAEPELPLDPTGALLAQRGKTHGDWKRQSQTTNDLKAVFRGTPNWGDLPATTQEALDMIASKLGRILCGNPNEPDHYDDIIGYTRLARDGGHR